MKHGKHHKGGGPMRSVPVKGTSPKINVSNPTGGLMRGSAGEVGRARNPNMDKSYTKKGNP